MIIREIRSEDVEEVANLHIETIDGFISDLGLDFVKRLYKEICSSGMGFGYIYEEDRKIKGFIAATTDVVRLYRRIACKKGIFFLSSLIKSPLGLSAVKKIIQPIFYPLRAKSNYGKAEILFIAVKAELRRKQIGKYLLERAMDEFKKREAFQVKVFSYDKNIGAKSFYLSQGFKYIETFKHNHDYLNVYLINL